jgi:very-short-patch-repair endonuclease
VDPYRELEALAASQGGVFSLRQARMFGISDDAVRRAARAGKLVVVHPGVLRFGAAPVSWLQAVTAARMWGGHSTWVSHRAAGAMWGLEGVPRGWVELTTVRNLRTPAAGVLVHRVKHMPACDVTTRGIVPVTNVARTLIDLGGVVSADELEAALDHSLRSGLTSLARLTQRLGELGGKGRPGSGIVRQLLAERRGQAPTESVVEARLSTVLRAAGLPAPTRQLVVRDGDRFVARVDFAYPKARVIIEVDGYRYHSGRSAWQRDIERNNALLALGWSVMHVTWEQIRRRPERVVSQLRTLLAASLVANRR